MDGAPNLNRLWADLIIEELVRCGADFFVLSPGSRSAPLVAAAAANARVRSTIHYDERGAAWYAVGYAQAARRPAVLICTSGTAAANYFPAIIEAAYSFTPLLVLTADRPPELVDAGANQTIRQAGLYGSYVRWAHVLPCPTREAPPASVLAAVDQAVRRAMGRPAGPVHLNCPYREPLAPRSTGEDFADYTKGLARWSKTGRPFTDWRVKSAGSVKDTPAPDADIDEVIAAISRSTRGCILAGRLDTPNDRTSVLALARTIGWPVLPDVCSGLRLGISDPFVITHFDAMLAARRVRDSFQPDAVLHFGGALTSKRLLEQVQVCAPETYVHIDGHNRRCDPSNRVTLRVESDIQAFTERLLRELHTSQDISSPQRSAPCATSWTDSLAEQSKTVEKVLDAFLTESDALSEPAVCRLISLAIPNTHALFLGNSMPIRDMDAFAAAGGACPEVFANRGASGIDGNLASTAGIAEGRAAGVTAVVGDLAFLHDLNSLALAARTTRPVVLIVLNNNGGGIFHFLEIAGFPDILERFFVAPHGLTFSKAAELFNLRYAHPGTKSELVSAYRAGIARNASTLIEIVTDRVENVKVHSLLQERIVNALERG